MAEFQGKQQDEDTHNVAQMTEMMARLGIDSAGGVVPDLSLRYATALHRCQSCPRKQACRDWLSRKPVATTMAPAFCLNADIFFELQFDQQRRTPAPHGCMAATAA